MHRLGDLAREHVCRHSIVLDIGSGSGSSTRFLLEVCGSKSYVIGIDVDLSRLVRARSLLEPYSAFHLVDLVCCNASMLPIRSGAVSAVTMFLTLHEAGERVVDRVLSEIRRVLKSEGMLLFVDKILFTASTPSEELTMLTEEAYHRAVEYVKGVKLWGLREPNEYMAKLREHGFEPILVEIHSVGKHVDGETFLRSWGKETLMLLEQVKDELKRRELIELIQRIRGLGARHGYGPSRALLALLKLKRVEL